ncbi:MAG: hypothetical protein EOO88_60285, partial [Pedobacter sp.]
MRLLLLSCLVMAGLNSPGQNLKSGGKLKPAQANMDIRHYTIALNVDPVNEFINGYTEIDLQLIKAANIILFDFWKGLNIEQVWVDGKTNPFVHSQDDLIKISLPRQHAAGKVKVKIAYSGKPGIATRPPWTGGFQWSKDSQGNPWIALT